MNYKFLILFLFITTSVFSQITTQELELEYTAHFGKPDLLTLEFYLKNNTKDTVVIHRPRALNYRPNGNPPVPNIPEFYKFNILTDVEFCEIAPYFVDSYKGIPTKNESDFLIIPPMAQQQIFFSNRETEQMICNENIDEIKVKFTYDFDTRYLDRTFFDKHVTKAAMLSPEKSEQLFQLLKKSYHGKIESKTITLNLKNLREHRDDEFKKAQAIRKAKRTYNIDISDLILADFLGYVSAIKVNVGEAFKEDNLENLQKQVVSTLDHASSYHTIVTQNDKIKWFLGSQRSKKSQVHIYDYDTVMDSINLSLSLLAAQKNNTILKDMEIVDIYLPVQNMGATSYRLLDKSIFIILRDQEKSMFYLRLRKTPIYKTQLQPISLTEIGYEWQRKSYGSSNDNPVYLYRKLENGDLIYGQKRAWEKGLNRGQAYFIRLENDFKN